MSKYAIIIIGNIASGKSTLATLIKKNTPWIEIICIDEIRKQIIEEDPNIDGITRERRAERMALEAIHTGDHIIYESTGTSLFYKRALIALKKRYTTYIIKINLPQSICYERHIERLQSNYYTVSPGFKTKLDIRSMMGEIEFELKTAKQNLTLDSEYNKGSLLFCYFLIDYANYINKIIKLRIDG